MPGSFPIHLTWPPWGRPLPLPSQTALSPTSNGGCWCCSNIHTARAALLMAVFCVFAGFRPAALTVLSGGHGARVPHSLCSRPASFLTLLFLRPPLATNRLRAMRCESGPSGSARTRRSRTIIALRRRRLCVSKRAAKHTTRHSASAMPDSVFYIKLCLASEWRDKLENQRCTLWWRAKILCRQQFSSKSYFWF